MSELWNLENIEKEELGDLLLRVFNYFKSENFVTSRLIHQILK